MNIDVKQINFDIFVEILKEGKDDSQILNGLLAQRLTTIKKDPLSKQEAIKWVKLITPPKLTKDQSLKLVEVIGCGCSDHGA